MKNAAAAASVVMTPAVAEDGIPVSDDCVVATSADFRSIP
jgi:hypothetical protein